jgi:Protein of unknown function (DUF1592)/Protein of unknown function (DUF1588)/Protein of unknown function (DUF1585)/Protein of unknown function (DUF1587)/Protein of unknown function (DUF1595)/Planctomycete cytochrome C
MRTLCGLLVLASSLAWTGPAACAGGPDGPGPGKNNHPAETISFNKQIQPLLARYCIKCHGGAKPKSDFALDIFKDEAAALKDLNVWDRVAQRIRAGEMPPPRRPQPTRQEVELIGRWVDAALGNADCLRRKDPGRVTLRRLNRAEYNNTIRDLVGIDFHPADDFPGDDVGYGFDNMGDVLSLSPLLFEKYLAAAEALVSRALADAAARRRIFNCQPADFKGDASGTAEDKCARKILENFARRAYRRPLHPGELDRLAGFVQMARAGGDNFDSGIRLALEAILTSPHFLFRVEQDRRPNDPTAIHPISEFELASRLSYFLWSTMPDDVLFELAEKRQLRKNLEAQVRRMLHDPRIRALTDNFADQWLQLRNLKGMTPDPVQYPSFDPALRAAMQQETELFFEAILKEDRSILDFIDADFTFVNEGLARHYGIPGIKGDSFRRVQLPAGVRGGLLTQASILTITSNPTRTSPVKRGKWILENILGTPPPPPPPDVPELKETKDAVLTGSLRQRMEQHRANPMCASCHQRMDPLGFAFENFDGVGAWRDKDGNFPIDASGTLPSGQTFQGPRELKAILKNQRELFCRCLTEKVLTYALGRGMETYDRCTVDHIAEALAGHNYQFSTLIVEVIKSDPFQMRRGKKGDK